MITTSEQESQVYGVEEADFSELADSEVECVRCGTLMKVIPDNDANKLICPNCLYEEAE